VQVGEMLVSEALSSRSKGRDNKTLAGFAEALRKVLDKQLSWTKCGYA
jgi:hypothetical protein